MHEVEEKRRGPREPRRLAEARWWYAVLAALALAVYLNSLQNPFVWDDGIFVVENPAIRRLGNIPSFFAKPWASERSQARYKKQGAIGWRPLTLVSYSLDYALYGPSAWGFRLTQLLLHLGCTLLFFALARSCLSAVPALVAAALFALHPVHTEVLNVITYRTTLLFSFFYLGGMLLHVWGRGRGLRWPTLVLVPLALAASCGSKEPGITLAGAVVIYDVATRRFAWRRVYEYLPVALVAALYLVARASLTESARFEVFGALSGWQVAWTQFKVLALDVSLLVWPDPLCSFYDWSILTPATTLGDPQAIAGFFAFVGLVALALVAYRRRAGALAFAAAWFLLALLPYAHILPHFDIAGERFLYLASAPWLLMLGLAVAEALHPERARGLRATALIVLVPLALAYAALTVRRNGHWVSNQRIHEQTVRDFPYGINAHIELGKIYFAAGRYREAAQHLRKALEIMPDLVPARRLLERAQQREKERR